MKILVPAFMWGLLCACVRLAPVFAGELYAVLSVCVLYAYSVCGAEWQPRVCGVWVRACILRACICACA